MAAPLTVFLMVFGLDLTRKFLSDFLPRMINKRGTDERELVDNIKHKKYELSQISPQNEFSKYAKLRRVIDKLQEKAKTKGIEHQKKRIKLKGALWVLGMVLTVLCQSFLAWTYMSSPLIILPEEWLYPLTVVLKFPTNVNGAIGLPAWLLICNCVIFQLKHMWSILPEALKSDNENQILDSS